MPPKLSLQLGGTAVSQLQHYHPILLGGNCKHGYIISRGNVSWNGENYFPFLLSFSFFLYVCTCACTWSSQVNAEWFPQSLPTLSFKIASALAGPASSLIRPYGNELQGSTPLHPLGNGVTDGHWCAQFFFFFSISFKQTQFPEIEKWPQTT